MLRDYQQIICERTLRSLKRHRSVMVQMPTGTGKTVTLAALLQVYAVPVGKQSAQPDLLIVAHTRELIEQIKSTIRRMELDVSHIHVESIQTVSRRIVTDRISIRPSLVIIDEAHHALANTYQLLWKQWPKARFLGLTATPYRLNGAGFTDLFDELILADSIAHFMAEGWLSPFDYYSIPLDSDESRAIASLRKRNVDGDYQTKEMRDVLDVRPTLERLYASQMEFAPGRKGIVYAIDITHAEHIAEFYSSKGLSAKAISAATPKQERKADLDKFRIGEIQVLVNVDLFSEGFDCPDVEFIQLARPTLSLAKYLQMVGRGLRRHEGKACCIILDNVGLYRRFGLPSDDRDWKTYFRGDQQQVEALDQSVMALRSVDTDWSQSIRNTNGRDVSLIQITSHEQIGRMVREQSDFVQRKKNWTDNRNGITYPTRPVSVLFRGVELSTADGEQFYPRIRSAYIRPDKGISRRCLQMQVGYGLFWQGLLIPGNLPDRVFEMEKRHKSGFRIFHDERGERYIQTSPDDPLRILPSEEAFTRWFESWKVAREKWQEDLRYMIRTRTAAYDHLMQAIRQHRTEVVYLDGDIAQVMDASRPPCWIDRRTGFVHYSRPRLFKRGFLEILQEEDMFFVRNVRDESHHPFRNHMLVADDEIAMIEDRLYVRNEFCMGCYKVKYRSDDFTYFRTGMNRYQRDYDTDVEIIHKPGSVPTIKLSLK
ncbi:DEAD/DEAH box helicase [Parabacteroides distasonis]|nr:DEAD/DEAH box helicase [Parabacteroides distasonis]